MNRARVLIPMLFLCVLILSVAARGQGERARLLAVRHAQEPICQTMKNGLPVVSEAGYVQLRDKHRLSDYWAGLEWQRRSQGKGVPPRGYGEENWGQVDAFCSLTRALEKFHNRTGRRARIAHISGRDGGFPDLTGQGRSSHLSHQTGQQFNLMLVPQDDKLGRVRSDGEKPAWDREATRVLVETMLEETGWYCVTHRATTLLGEGEKTPQLAAFPEKPTKTTESAAYHFDDKGRLLLLLKGKGNHSDHVNVLFWPQSEGDFRNRQEMPVIKGEDPWMESGLPADAAFVRIEDESAWTAVFLDGRFVGFCGPGKALRLALTEGAAEFRFSAGSSVDLVQRATMVRLSKRTGVVPIPSTHAPSRIAVGQTVRGWVGSRDGRGSKVFEFEAARGQRRSVVLYGEKPGASVAVVSPDGKVVPLQRIRRVSGLPSTCVRHEWTCETSGVWRLLVMPKKKRVSFVLGLEKALPPFWVPPGKPRSKFRVPGKPEKS